MANNERLFDFDAEFFGGALDSQIEEIRVAAHKAIGTSIRKAKAKAVTIISDEIRNNQKWNISKRDLDRRLQIKSGSRSDYTDHFELIIKGTALSLSYFGAKQFTGNKVITRKKGWANKRQSKFQGVQVEIKKGKKTRLSQAFMQAASSGHVMVLHRKGKNRYPIGLKKVISPASIFSSEDTEDNFSAQIDEFMAKTFEHELEYQLQKAGLL